MVVNPVTSVTTEGHGQKSRKVNQEEKQWENRDREGEREQKGQESSEEKWSWGRLASWHEQLPGAIAGAFVQH